LAGDERGLWLVNVALADDNGLGLADELRRIDAQRRVVLVSDEYEPDIERAARACGLPFVCKPAQVDWLSFGQATQQIPATPQRLTVPFTNN
jgi:ActR/RegA family two-component response regulator